MSQNLLQHFSSLSPFIALVLYAMGTGWQILKFRGRVRAEASLGIATLLGLIAVFSTAYLCSKRLSGPKA